MEFLTQNHLLGFIIGLCTFLIIGVFHPIVIKSEYHFGTRCWWVFLLLGLVGIAGTFLIDNILLAILCGVAGFSCLWSIHELIEQQERVRKGWFPRNPKRKYPFDKEK